VTGTPESVTFYDQHPFDWVPIESSEDIDSVVSKPLVELIQSLDVNSLVLDIGCGPGRVLGFLKRRGIRCIGLDRSRVSLGLAIRRYDTPGAVGDNLHLPFADESADVVISDGVIHHTADPLTAFTENFRILKPGGRMYLAVYKPKGRYPLLYKFPGGLIRGALRHGWSKPFVTLFFRVPYYAIHFIRSKGRRTWSGARNLFYDYFVTPQVVFLPRRTIEEWCAKQRARIVRYDENFGQNVHSFLVEKEQQTQSRRDLTKGVIEDQLIQNKESRESRSGH
jgi:SAM-dependent methyltransferase